MNKSALAAPRCPGTLKEGFSTYCAATLRSVFSGRQVFHVLNGNFSEEQWKAARTGVDTESGQHRFRMTLSRNRLIPDKNGDYLLMTVFPGGSALRFHMEQPGNEHLCLQMAKQVYELETLSNALIFFADGQPAIICRYWPAFKSFIDFESLQAESGSRKPVTTYYRVAQLVDLNCAAQLIARERLFSQVLFSWMISNVKAHAKNSGLVKTPRGDYTIAPLFIATCSRLHELGPELALPGGLFDGDKNTAEFRENGNYTRNEFTAFASRIRLHPQRAEKIMDKFINGFEKGRLLVDRSFLPGDVQAIIRFNLQEKISRLK